MAPSPSWKSEDPPAQASQAEEPEEPGAPESITNRFAEEQELLRRHIRILKVVKENEPVGIIKLSELTGFPQHKVRYSLRVLEQEGLIEPSSMGARATDRVEAFLPELAALVDSMQETVEELRETLQ